ncbi:MAG TPA: diaminobutyrate acetyltransferase [Vampirovibrionales bacterium]
MKLSNKQCVLAKPTKDNASAIFELLQLSPPLEVNSLYSYLLLCSHFSDTCVVAFSDEGEVVGFLSAYLVPSDPSRLFVWQVAVHKDFRRQNLAQRMLKELLTRKVSEKVNFIEATVMPSNIPSNKFFESLAKDLNTTLKKETFFSSELFGKESHEEEVLLSVGPLK